MHEDFKVLTIETKIEENDTPKSQIPDDSYIARPFGKNIRPRNCDFAVI